MLSASAIMDTLAAGPVLEALTEDPRSFERVLRARWTQERGRAAHGQVRRGYSFRIPELGDTVCHMADHVDGLLENAAGERRQLLDLLKQDLKELRADGIPYDRLLETASSFCRSMAALNCEPLPWRMAPYHWFMQSAPATVEWERLHYGERSGMNAPAVSRFPVNARFIFGEDLKCFVLPLPGLLEELHFIRTRTTTLILVSILKCNVLVDGYLMTPFTMLKHDMCYHASLRYKGDCDYFAERSWNAAQIEDFRRMQESWMTDLLERIRAITDERLRRAVLWLLHESVHNRGRVFAPSSFRGWLVKLHTLWRNDIKNLSTVVLLKGATGCGSSAGEVLRMSRLAQEWITAFWDRHAGTEL